MPRRNLRAAFTRAVAGVALAALCGGCGPSIDAAAKADIDRRVAALGAPKQTYGAPTSFAPRAIVVGQWTEHKVVDPDGRAGFMTYKVVGQEHTEQGDAFWVEMAQDRDTGHTAMKMLLTLGDRRTPQSISVRGLKMKDKNGRVTEFDAQMVNMMGALFRSSVSMLVISWEGGTQEDAAVPAGVFPGCYKVRTDASWGPFSSASMSWSHPEVPLSGLVKSQGLDRPTTMELVGFGETGATSEFP